MNYWSIENRVCLPIAPYLRPEQQTGVELWSFKMRFSVALTVTVNAILLFKTQTIVSEIAAPLPPLVSSNNVMKLIIRTYLNEILSANELNESHLKSKLSSLSDHIASHPALHQRYLWVGSTPPSEYDPDQEKETQDSVSQVSTDIRKRDSVDKEKFPSEEICKTSRQWEQINSTHDLYDNKVEVVQEEDMQQFVFSYRCANLKGECMGISPLYHSECTERNGWMYMYYKQANNKAPQWGYVSAPHHCACKLQPKFIPTVASEEN